MKKFRHLTAAIAVMLAFSLITSSCIGSFALTGKVMKWNKQVGNKFVNEIVFVAFCILPVYELYLIADVLVINSIEFWSGSNPVMAQTQVIDGKDARYLVKTDKNGHTIINMNDKSEVRFNFDEMERSWSVEADGKEVKLFTWVDDNHVNVITPDGNYRTIETSQQGLFAFRQLAENTTFFAKK